MDFESMGYNPVLLLIHELKVGGERSPSESQGCMVTADQVPFVLAHPTRLSIRRTSFSSMIPTEEASSQVYGILEQPVLDHGKST